MTDNSSTFPKGKISKKQLRKTIQEKLTVTLADYKTLIGEKKFDSRVRKAARQIGDDVIKSLPRKKKLKKAEKADKALTVPKGIDHVFEKN